MKKIKFKIKIPTEFVNLKNFFITKLKKINKFIKFKFFNNYFTDNFNKIKKFKYIKFIKISNLSMSIILFVTLSFLYLFYLSIPTLYNKETLQKDITNKLIKEFKINFISCCNCFAYSLICCRTS